MKVRIIKIGKPALKDYRPLVEEYQSRISRYTKFESLEVKVDNPEKTLITKKSKNQDFLVCLDERGEQWSSEKLAQKITNWQANPAIGSVSFLIGGPYGLPDELKDNADELWSLSNAVFPSDLAWLAASEQIYRAFTIIAGTGYHHA